MYRRASFKGLFLGMIILNVSCGRSDLGSKPSYVPWGLSQIKSATIAKALEPELKICLEGSLNPKDLDRVRLWSVQATLTWLRPLKVIDDRITGQIVFSCVAPHLTIRLRQGGGTSYASPGSTTIYLTRPYGTWTHELGHAFAGLGDTYFGSSAGSCMSGQPQSLMCWGAYGPRSNPAKWSTLWPDDINGLRFNYSRLHKGEFDAPEWGHDMDLEAPLDVTSPWPAFDRLSFKVTFRDANVNISDQIQPSSIDEENKLRSIDL